MRSYQQKLNEGGFGAITTEIKEDQIFYYAEEYHQQYLAKPGSRPYCSAMPTRILLGDFEGSHYKLDEKIVGNNKSIIIYEDKYKIKTKDILDIGFSGLVAQVIKVKKDYLSLKTTSQGLLENNKGVHLKNRTIKLNFLTQKDFKAIKIAKEL